MVAQPDYLPQNEHEHTEVAAVLANNPDIRTMVEKIAGHAATYFVWMTVVLDSKQYDDWDPPLKMTITVPYFSEEDWTRHYREFKTWLVRQPDYDLDRLSVVLLPRKVREAQS